MANSTEVAETTLDDLLVVATTNPGRRICLQCGLVVAVQSDDDRHETEYGEEECPTQLATVPGYLDHPEKAHCWCEDLCWGELFGACWPTINDAERDEMLREAIRRLLPQK
jgi:hypothetical protein